MSFSELRKARAARRPLSFLINAPNDTTRNIQNESEESRDSSSPGSAALTSSSQQPEPETSDATEPVRLLEGCYKELPPVVSVKSTKSRGRGLYANVNIPAGSVVISVKPHACVLSKNHLNRICSSCCDDEKTESLKRCPSCKLVWYCSTACQKEDWNNHKSECEALQRWKATATNNEDLVAPEPVRCLARLLWKRKKLGSQSPWVKELDGLLSHDGEVSELFVKSQIFMAQALVRYMGMKSPVDLEAYGISGFKHLVALLSQFATNTFSLSTTSLNNIGCTVSPLAALINHSCEHNVSILFPRSNENPRVGDEPLLEVVAFRDIRAGSELFTTYVDVCLPRLVRQEALKETYNFTCSCALCTPSLSWMRTVDPREAMLCPAGCGGFARIPQNDEDNVACVQCGAEPDVQETINLLRVAKDELGKIQQLASSDTNEAISRSRRILTLIRSRLPPTSHPHLDLLVQHQSLLTLTLFASSTTGSGDNGTQGANNTDTGLMRELRETSEELCNAYLALLPFGHPVRALGLAQFGEVLSVSIAPDSTSNENDGDDPVKLLARSISTLQQAHSELRTAFGTRSGGGRAGRKIRERLVGLEKEMEVWRGGLKNVREFG